ncbi:DNA repair protein XRCC3 homolog [Spinacia oleracea]|uniref:DNA repair protein XRCC3 homolog n=1 Tax=Spinacia oleracea TaxID=3562 RepID=A0A9R0I8R2_SPIOL|nr:DNA repair protein XRCC3 homolog [Spinacia oleracea]XP_056683277.1 DNA repair protein XRCC3 homolog [Spinacia oleracea]XP_056688895.1 DNA repair protein XRCC3 homolog [Spinacia oleracea]XP_056690281.1 DNA repair protein XRCC3 homolog [Spinacia oleracea]XP_056692285.1 DNA repair protein XRCC3 homolog [Spinacia oleracea]XP_056694752.1 DNA repair protein XRCC3 homolog [Spinacia oleracea]XP_056694782.1 DNA repair protein XRCC3 homolog [Spinacia oleracea]XP_056694785.1 DNA repair protein XRCC3
MATSVNKITTRCSEIDSMLSGGITIGEVTEVCGENASGDLETLNGNPLDYITTKQVDTPHEIPDVLEWTVKLIKMSQNSSMPIRVVVIDSIGSMFTGHFENNVVGSTERKDLIQAIGYGLRTIAASNHVAVVVANNVIDVFPSDHDTTQNFIISSGRKVRPALGASWTRNVRTRLMLSKRFNSFTQQIDRFINIAFSPSLEVDACMFNITEEGIVGVCS